MVDKREFIYLASPYRHPDAEVREKRFIRACIQAGLMMKAGLLVYSPIAHSHPIETIAYGGVEQGIEFWMEQDLPMLKMCSMMQILMLDGWNESKGIRREVNHAIENEIFIGHIDEGDIMNLPKERSNDD